MSGKRPLVADRAKQIPLSGIRVFFEKALTMSDVVRLEVGEPDFETPAHIREAAKKALDEGYTGYTSSSGYIELRQALAEKLKRDNGIDADPKSEIVVTAGACCAINLATSVAINPGDEVLIPDPCWPHYEPCIKLAGGTPVTYSLPEESEFRPDIDEVRDKITPKTRMMLVNSPSNPTGGMLTRSDLEEISDLAVDHDLLVISDEVYEKINYGEVEQYSVASRKDMRDRTITVNAFSKTYAMTGWRLGYAVANKEIVTEMAKINLYTNTCANSIAQRAGIAALTGPQDCVAEMVAEYKRRRDFITKSLNDTGKITCTTPKGAFYVFANIKRLAASSFDFAMSLLDKAHVSSVPGASFGPCGEGYLRMSYANSIENIQKAMDRIQKSI